MTVLTLRQWRLNGLARRVAAMGLRERKETAHFSRMLYWVPPLFALLQAPVIAGETVINQCTGGLPGFSLSFMSSLTQVINNSPVIPEIATTNFYTATATAANGTTVTDGYACVIYQLFDGLPDAPTGNTLQLTEQEAEAQIRAIILQDLLQQIKGKASSSIINQDYNPAPAPITAPFGGRTPAVGVLGFLGSLSGGFALHTGTPGYNSFGNDSLNVGTNVPFVVDSAAPGDSLSIYGPAGLIWSQPLANFTPGLIYFAQIPAQTTDATQAVVMTYWIHSADQGVSSVYFPAQLVLLDAPTIVPVVTGTLGTNGWYTGVVSVAWTVTVADGGVITSETGCGPIVISADTLGAISSCSASTAGGSTSQSVTIPRDATPPTATITLPANGASYAQSSINAAAYACRDALSGVAACAGTVAVGSPIDTTTPGTKSFVVNATDLAGNVSTATSTYTVIAADSGPTVTPILSGTLGDNGWYRSTVSLSWQVSDPAAPIISSSGCTPSTVAYDTKGVTFTCMASSQGGSKSSTVTIKRDDDAPFLALLLPFDGLSVKLRAKVPAVYFCLDFVSGMASCSGNVANGAPLDTGSTGTKTFTVTARDNAGNSKNSTVHYVVH
jgi:hypothetical protein